MIKEYKSPKVEIIEIEVEDAILALSGDGYDTDLVTLENTQSGIYW